MQNKIARRLIVKGGLIAGLVIPALAVFDLSALAAGLPPLDSNDPNAKALGFVTDASKVDSVANPRFKSTQKCGTCAQFKGAASAASAACTIFPGKSVPSTGWCKVWAAKS